MTMHPWTHPQSQQMQLVAIPKLVLNALARGEAVDDAHSSLITPYLAGVECIGLWRMRSEQIVDTPSDAPWVTRLIIVPGVDGAVGIAGFHGAPDGAGMVEVGYRIAPEYRRRGYARRALETLLSVASASADVQIVRATISPENHPSRSLVDGYGFTEVGEQWDEEDGLETIFEVAARGSGAA
ncbi:acetyltransferase (GNAT) family protein [Rhodoglobus vestalii]|uniref:Acetyltransferase (GNAT) family protein n=2 Tax=Rhodoglobus vestalii TaxID=193384 RepID=A0A8H2PTZ5_9MICO|nr:acetyltransferase (GNAT) family protein [Rhodoglobus vestalii]